MTIALEHIATTTRDIFGAECVLNIEKNVYITDPNVATNLYYIVLEAVNNFVNYARASKITINMNIVDDKLEISIRDEGAVPVLHKEKVNGEDLKIMEYRSRLIGASFALQQDETGSHTVTIGNIGI